MLPAGLLASIAHITHQGSATLWGDGRCCLVATLAFVDARHVALVNVGDSAGYIFHGDVLITLSTADRACDVARVAGEPVFMAGMPMIRTGITQVVGQRTAVWTRCADHAAG